MTSVVITIRSYYSPRMPGVPSADVACRTARIPRAGTEKNHARGTFCSFVETRSSRVYISVSRPFFPCPSRSPSPHPFSLSLGPSLSFFLSSSSLFLSLYSRHNKRICSSLYITQVRLYRFDKQRQRVRAGSQEFTTHAATGCPGETDNGI